MPEKLELIEELFQFVFERRPQMLEASYVTEADEKFYDEIIYPILENDNEKGIEIESVYTTALNAHEKQAFIAGYRTALSLLMN